MLRSLSLLLLSFISTQSALAGGFVVWMEDHLPDEQALEKASKLVGDARHFSHLDLAFSPQPLLESDELAYAHLRERLVEAQNEWDEFDIELNIATSLATAVEGVQVVRDSADRKAIVDLLLFQGSAASKAFRLDDFWVNPDASSFRRQLPGVQVNAPWLDARGLAPSREFGQSDLADSNAYSRLMKQETRVSDLEKAHLWVGARPPGARLFVDGREIDESAAELPLGAGTHYAHALLHGDLIAGRQIFQLAPGEARSLALDVNDEQLLTAREQVSIGTTTGFPVAIKDAIASLMDYYEGPVFVGVIDGTKVRILPYAREAVLIPQRTLTFVVGGDLGAGMMDSSLFYGQVGAPVRAVGGSVGANFELGIYNAVVLGGFDLGVMPTHQARYGSSVDENSQLSAYPAPWGGLGAYVLRPTGDQVTAMVAGTYGWTFPAHWTWGSRVIVGIPMDDKSWFRIVAGFQKGNKLMTRRGENTWQQWYEGTMGQTGSPATASRFLRVGFATRF